MQACLVWEPQARERLGIVARHFDFCDFLAICKLHGVVGQFVNIRVGREGEFDNLIGGFFDDALHQVVGLVGRRYQDLYHFTVGGAADDPRLKTRPAYDRRD